MVQKIADMADLEPRDVIIIGIALVVIVIFAWIQTSIGSKKGANSQEKADIRKIINNLVPDGTEYTAVYASGKETHGSARMYRVIYHYYAVGFSQSRTDHLWVVPIGVEHGKIVYTKPMKMCAETLSYIGGNEKSLVLHFPKTKETCILSVDASNIKFGKDCPVNIQQKEEAEAFYAFAGKFQERVNATLGVDKKGRLLR